MIVERQDNRVGNAGNRLENAAQYSRIALVRIWRLPDSSRRRGSDRSGPGLAADQSNSTKSPAMPSATKGGFRCGMGLQRRQSRRRGSIQTPCDAARAPPLIHASHLVDSPCRYRQSPHRCRRLGQASRPTTLSRAQTPRPFRNNRVRDQCRARPFAGIAHSANTLIRWCAEIRTANFGEEYVNAEGTAARPCPSLANMCRWDRSWHMTES